MLLEALEPGSPRSFAAASSKTKDVNRYFNLNQKAKTVLHSFAQDQNNALPSKIRSH